MNLHKLKQSWVKDIHQTCVKGHCLQDLIKAEKLKPCYLAFNSSVKMLSNFGGLSEQMLTIYENKHVVQDLHS